MASRVTSWREKLGSMDRQYNMQRERQSMLAAGKLLQEGVPPQTVQFFTSVYSYMISGIPLSGVEMGEIANLTANQAQTHANRLVKFGVFERVHYRAWSLRDDYLIRFN